MGIRAKCGRMEISSHHGDPSDPQPYPLRRLDPQNNQWIGLRENLQETIVFPIKYGAFL